MDKKKIYKNTLTGFWGQVIVILMGIIVPRLLIVNYGSDTNGLISTITNIFTYMALLEAGIGQTIKNALYKPIIENDKNQISELYNLSKNYYKKTTIVYLIGVIILAICLPFVIKTKVNYFIVLLIVLFEGLSRVICYFFSQTETVVLTVFGKEYVNNVIDLLVKVFSYASKIFFAILGVNIIILELSYFLISLAKVIFYNIYFNKKYFWIKENKIISNIKLDDRNYYVITELAWVMFSATDILLLSIFVSTEVASVYTIYNMVFHSISLIINAMYKSIVYILGNTYYKDIKKYEIAHDSFNSLFVGLIVVTSSVSYILCMPFIKLYTSGVKDVNYIYENLPLLFCLFNIISWSRYVAGNLTGIAGFAKQTSVISLIEALFNVILSIILVKKIGIYGVVLGSVFALPVKVLWCNYIADVKVMKRNVFSSYKIIIANVLVFGIALLIKKYLSNMIIINNYKLLIIYGIMFSVIFGILTTIINCLINPNCIIILNKLLKR